MGCSTSKESNNDGDEQSGKVEFSDLDFQGSVPSTFVPTTGPLNAKDYKSRLASSEGTQTFFLPSCNFTVRYAYVTQRGYYPDAPDKANQDALCTHPQFAGDPEQALFGVFDGHGEYGTQCAQFARDKVAENLLNNTQFLVSPELAYHRSMVLTNTQLHRMQDVDDSMSGTTAIAVLLRGRTVYVANVGDSRCVLAECQGDRLIAQDLSFDQTPFRRDECERVKRCGARVLTLDQLEGLKDPNVEHWGTEEDNEGDPPRLWAPNATYPGTAFTRSIGDSAAERIGVFAEPEVVTKLLTSTNPFIIIASDGVWEFLTSQSVVDMVSKFEDPQEACFSVVAESYRLWLQHETRTDDITMIVVQLQGVVDAAPQMALPTPQGPLMDYSTRPAHGIATRRMANLRLPAIEASCDSAGDILEANGRGGLMRLKNHATTAPGSPRFVGDSQQQDVVRTFMRSNSGGFMSRSSTAQHVCGGSESGGPLGLSSSGHTKEELEFLEGAVSHSFLFASLALEHRRTVLSLFERCVVSEGDVVIRQGSAGDTFFVVESGHFDVFVQHSLLTDGGGALVGHHEQRQPDLVHTYVSQPGLVASFGELALLYSKQRAAMVVARTDGALWLLARQPFRRALRQAEVAQGTGLAQLPEYELCSLVRIMRSVEALHCLTVSQLFRLASAMSRTHYKEGDCIISQGEEGRDFFLIQAGEVVCTVRKNPDDLSEVPKEVLRLLAGQYFGERALLVSAQRAANVVALGDVTVLCISRDAFEAAMGRSLQGIFDDELYWKESLALQREMLAHKIAATGRLVQGNLSLEDLVARGLLFATDYSAIMLMEHKESEQMFTVRVTSVADIVQLGRQALVMQARGITRGLEPSFFVPGVLKSFKDERVLAEVLMIVGLCTLDMLMTPQPFDELSAIFVAASVVLGLEHLHWSNVIYRGLSVHSILLTEGGQVQLVDFRFARKSEGRAYTVCGNPEYLAPEVILGRCHNEAVDFWALGVLIFCMLSGETPFAGPGEDELRIYRNIVMDEVTMPAHFSPAAVDMLGQLLSKDPAARLGARPAGLSELKAHPWFQAISWDALTEHRYMPPPGIRERIYNFEGVSYTHFDPKSCEADITWSNAF